jgi:hypothetical protein
MDDYVNETDLVPRLRGVGFFRISITSNCVGLEGSSGHCLHVRARASRCRSFEPF